ncbi:MAG: O-methyltransferase [Chloroflexi bacterium]|jgi:predicted O-methyltransferase YrrM|nr:O-methyltransferase [Chloroflexota bacterium]
MSEQTWAAVDEYLGELFGPDDEHLAAALREGQAAGLPAISVSAPQGRLLYLLARAIGARRILEIGTLAGYSAIWLGRALPPDGRLVTLELDPHHAQVARASLERAGLGDRAEVIVGRALASLAQLGSGDAEPFDLVFIDADKDGYPDYLDWAVRLSRPGALIVADNVVRGGAVADEQDEDPSVVGVRRFLAKVAADDRLEAAVMQVVGAKGHDGLAIIRVR